jgi:hypothetical protein
VEKRSTSNESIEKEATMSKFKSVVQGAAERLLEDEGLRSNLTDDEANILINWAIEWLESRVDPARDQAAARQAAQAEIGRLRPALQEINRRLAASETPDAGVSLSLPSSGAAMSASPDRKTLIRSLIAQKVETWGKK